MYSIDIKESIEKLIGYFSKGGVKIREDGLVDIDISDSGIKSLEEIGCLLKVEIVGDLKCRQCNGLRDLSGCPKDVYGNFYCSYCNNLSSLKGGARYVEGDFECKCCKSLERLEGSPKVIKGDFICFICDNLESLEGGPSKIYGKFDCSYCYKLKDVKFNVKLIEKNLICEGCRSLEYINKSVIRKVKGKVYVSGSDEIKNMDELIEEFGDKIKRRGIYV